MWNSHKKESLKTTKKGQSKHESKTKVIIKEIQ